MDILQATLSDRVSSDLDPVPLGENLSPFLSNLFSLTGPIAHYWDIQEATEKDPPALNSDSSLLKVLHRCKEAVAVPFPEYWSARTENTNIQISSELSSTKLRSSLETNFFSIRNEAIANSDNYSPERGDCILGIDFPSGKGAKMFRVFSRDKLISWVYSLTPPQKRCTYVIVDPKVNLDFFSDLDISIDIINEVLYSQNPHQIAENQTLPQRNSSNQVVSSSLTDNITIALEEILYETLYFFQYILELFFLHSVQDVLVCTSSAWWIHSAYSSKSEESNLLIGSFHIHYRMCDGCVFLNLWSLHLFMERWRNILHCFGNQPEHQNSDNIVSGSVNTISLPMPRPKALESPFWASIIYRAIDWSIYTSWRAFRLPFQIKSPPYPDIAVNDGSISGGKQSALSKIQWETQVEKWLEEFSEWKSSSSIWVSSLENTEKRRIGLEIDRAVLPHLPRPLIPMLPGTVNCLFSPLHEFIDKMSLKKVSVSKNFDITDITSILSRGLIQRFAESSDLSSPFHQYRFSKDDFEVSHKLRVKVSEILDKELQIVASISQILEDIKWNGSGYDTEGIILGHTSEYKSFPDKNNSSIIRFSSNFSAKIPVTNPILLSTLAEIFQSLAAPFDNIGSNPYAISPYRISASFEPSYNAYYVRQKFNRFCLRLQRRHRATYGQLFITFGSVKFQCFSNDCLGACMHVPWGLSGHQISNVSNNSHEVRPGKLPRIEVTRINDGYPKFSRLIELQQILYPQSQHNDDVYRRIGIVI